MKRRGMCERIMRRTLRASDNLLKFCVHGGSIPRELAARMFAAAGGGSDSDDDGSGSGDGEAASAAAAAEGGAQGKAAAAAAVVNRTE
jgi:hypothetical protein